MSELDVVKEQIAYLKVWLGIMVAIDISLFGWLITHYESAPPRIAAACVIAILAVTGAIALFHWRIKRHIKSLGRL